MGLCALISMIVPRSFAGDNSGSELMLGLIVGFEMLVEHTDLDVLGARGYISAGKAAELWRKNHVCLRTIPRRNQKKTTIG